MGISIRSQPWRTKVISDFDEIFSVGKAFNSKLIDKKIFQKAYVLMEISGKYYRHHRPKIFKKRFSYKVLSDSF